ncbi:MAG: polyprenyl synthetase family protein [Nitrosopumilus sp.]|uniref:Geranylgeranyl pyrophosphate synthase n=1 Tax=Nitrosopumilus zosterae TaxID=718286 RepID=A0A2S2KQ63_9ARCH|nr:MULTISPECIES: polyprenyl synthetase family protein [Nitrosopumilus]MCV0366440.1 polyprenyl synthetase family protein [Nitrosopumilus sp.]BDQ31605.1 polyprenyl synthetase family protein [Nitrosopumilus zosterae]GBH33812.1 geranylgeranyl pyrophosphate synthase [Nitrosopumilus zosterae]
MKKTKQIEKNAKTVNRYLNSKLKGNPKKLYDAAGHLIVNGGKRLRPYMVIRSCQILGGKSSNAMPAASAVEMVHNFTLVHDDIMDNDEMRHGVPTVHKKFGMPIAILAGDVLFSKAFQVITDSKLSPNATIQLVSRLAKACVDVCEGQLLDVKMAEEEKIPTEAEYITMVSKKTAALFDVSCAMGAICATSRIKDISNLSSFGRNLGIAFQITDDLIGVMGDPKLTKKPVGNDLREGKKSLPILMAIKSAKGKDKKIILKAFGNSKISKNDLNKAVDVIRSLNIEENVRKQALKYADMAEKSLSTYSNPAKAELISLLDFVVKRSV